MSDHERDRAEDWRLPQHSRPPLLGELVERIDEALATARASEAAVMTVGAAALDAAEQARRAADLAERAWTRRAEFGGPVAAVAPSPPTTAADGRLGSFSERADRLAERLRALERMPLSRPRQGEDARGSRAFAT